MEPIRYGMAGGGEGAFVGALHRTAAMIAGNWRLVAGALSASPEKARRSGRAIGIPRDRAYGDYQEMLAREDALPPDQRIDAVAIVTPNNSHAPIAIAALEAGFHVICDKPLAHTLIAARAIQRATAKSAKRVAVTHTYTGYPMVKQARTLVTGGALGAVRRVIVRYTQDWLSRAEDIAGNKQAEWRQDPNRSGECGAFGDIGTHAANLVEYITGEHIAAVCAELRALPGRRLDDDGAALFRLQSGGSGVLTASQICVGDANDLSVSIYCDEAGLHWRQEDPNILRVARRDKPDEIWRSGSNRPYVSPHVAAIQRTPGGHPEGYLEAFANIYRAFGEEIRTGARTVTEPGYATIEDAIRSMQFASACKRSSDRGSCWVNLADVEDGGAR